MLLSFSIYLLKKFLERDLYEHQNFYKIYQANYSTSANTPRADRSKTLIHDLKAALAFITPYETEATLIPALMNRLNKKDGVALVLALALVQLHFRHRINLIDLNTCQEVIDQASTQAN